MYRPLCTAVLLLLAIAPACAQEGRRRTVELRSFYLVEPLALPDIGKGHTVVLHIEPDSEKGTFTLDPNTCMLSPFGDPLACTEMAGRRFAVTLKPAKVADPLDLERRLYLLAGLPGKAVLHLVVPRDGEPGHRLVVSDAEDGVTAIVPLQPVAPRGEGKK